MLGTISKTYTAVEPGPADYCIADVPMSDGDGPELCSRHADVVIEITTVALNGRTYKSRSMLCYEHLSRRYRRWFKV